MKSWKVGVFVGLGFHLALAFSSPTRIKGFTTLLFALFLFFTPRDFAARISEHLSGLDRALRLRERLIWLRLAGLAVLCGLIFALLGTIENNNKLYKDLFEFAFWIPGTAITLLAYSMLPQSRMDSSENQRVSGLRTLLWIAPLTVAFIGLNPYIGLRTGAAWSMFSNLRTDAGYNNHLFMPSTFRVAGFQDDLVEVERYKAGTRKRRTRYDGKKEPFFKLLRAMEEEERDFVVKFARNGKLYKVSQVNGELSDPEIAAAMSESTWLEKWYLVFRRIDNDDTKQSCVH